MTTVEELRFAVLDVMFLSASNKLLDSLISAVDANAFARGVAEGAEQERERIWEAQLIGYRVQLFQFPNDERNGVRTETAVNGKVYTVVPASVLAPTKGVAG